MEPRRNPDGTLTVPVRVTGPGGATGDGMATIGPDDPQYAAWDEWLALAGHDDGAGGTA